MQTGQLALLRLSKGWRLRCSALRWYNIKYDSLFAGMKLRFDSRCKYCIFQCINDGRVLIVPMFFTLKINDSIDHFIFWSGSKYVCTLTLYGTKWWRYQYAYSHVCLISSNSLILIFKKLNREEMIPRSFYFSSLFFNIIKEDLFVSRKRKRRDSFR